MALTEARVRAIVREELVAMFTGAATPTAAKAPARTKASSTAKPNTFVQDIRETRAAGTLVCTREDHAAGCPGTRGERNAAGRKVFGRAGGLAYHMGE